jgi:hypothetical protein
MASVWRAVVRRSNVPGTCGTSTGRDSLIGASAATRSSFLRTRRVLRSGACAKWKRRYSRASTAVARTSQSARFSTSSAGKPTRRTFCSASVQYRVTRWSVCSPVGSLSSASTGFVIRSAAFIATM